MPTEPTHKLYGVRLPIEMYDEFSETAKSLNFPRSVILRATLEGFLALPDEQQMQVLHDRVVKEYRLRRQLG